MQQDNFGLKIDLRSIIESKTPPIINFEFWDWDQALTPTQATGIILRDAAHIRLGQITTQLCADYIL